jgi:hypothetical protein
MTPELADTKKIIFPTSMLKDDIVKLDNFFGLVAFNHSCVTLVINNSFIKTFIYPSTRVTNREANSGLPIAPRVRHSFTMKSEARADFRFEAKKCTFRLFRIEAIQSSDAGNPEILQKRKNEDKRN